MYAVMSKWEPLPGCEDEVQKRSSDVRAKMRTVSGIEFMHGFRNESGQYVVVMGYADEPTYQKIIHNPQGPFAQALADSDLEKYARWVSSERGEMIE